jgi:CRP-like cAMP-binding protein
LTPLRKFIESYVTLSDNDWALISQCFERREVEKESIVLEQGKICRHLYFLESGLMRFYINKDGNDVTKFFNDPPYMFTSQRSFNNNSPSTEGIESIERSIIYQISYEQSTKLFELNSWAEFGRKITQEVQFFTEEILEELQTETAENRYIKMLKSNPDLVNRIPLKHLASYLGIAPQSLSRIRKKLSQ